MSEKKLSWAQQGKALSVTVFDGRTSQQWTIRPTHTAGQKAESFRDIAEALAPGLTVEPVPYYPPERTESIPQQGPVPPPLFDARKPFVSRYEPSQGVPSVIPEDPNEAASLEALKAEAYRKAQQYLGVIKGEGAPDGIDLVEVNSTRQQPYQGAMPGLGAAPEPAGGYRPDQQVRQRPKPGAPNFYFDDTH